MARLTQQDKAANKAAQKIRDRAYHARLKEFRDAQAKVEKSHEAGPEAAAATAARQALDAAVGARNAEQEDIRRQIAALQDRLGDASREHEPLINAAKAARDTAWALQDDLRRAQLERVATDFADVAEVQYVGAWPIPAVVQRQMDEAAASARLAAADAVDD